jgi:hypothetical protein
MLRGAVPASLTGANKNGVRTEPTITTKIRAPPKSKSIRAIPVLLDQSLAGSDHAQKWT